MQNKTRLVQGVGVNDADYHVYVTKSVGGRQEFLFICPYYSAWTRMMSRCYSEKFHIKNPSYIGCSVDPEWNSFMSFRAWMDDQDWKEKQLDKDILVLGNKVYSPEFCVFVPGYLNKFLEDSASARGKYPLGVCLNNPAGKFRALCGNPFTGKQDHLGMFIDVESAGEAWRIRKHEHACRYADMQTDQRIAQALRIRYAKQATQ